MGSVNRNFAGFGREIFTDTGVYALRMDAASVSAEPQHLISNTHMKHDYRVPLSSGVGGQELQGIGEVAAGRGMTLDERAVMLAAAVSIDFDYFSRHSSMGHGGLMPVGVFGAGEQNARTDGGVADAAGLGMVDSVVRDSMDERQFGEKYPQQEPVQPHQQQEQDHLYPYAPPPQNQPFSPPPAQESQDSGGFWSLFDEEG